MVSVNAPNGKIPQVFSEPDEQMLLLCLGGNGNYMKYTDFLKIISQGVLLTLVLELELRKRGGPLPSSLTLSGRRRQWRVESRLQAALICSCCLNKIHLSIPIAGVLNKIPVW
jgi:hypothetical protein